MARKNSGSVPVVVMNEVVSAREAYVTKLSEGMVNAVTGISTTQDQITQLNAQLANQVADVRAHKAQLETLGVELPKLPKDIAEMIDEVPAPARRGRPLGSKNAKSSGKRPHNEGNLVEALQSVLKGKELGIEEAVTAVEAAGYKSTSPNFKTIVNQALVNKNNAKIFKRVARGIYTAR